MISTIVASDQMPALPYFRRTFVAAELNLLRAQVDFELSGSLPPPPVSESAKRGLRYERKVLHSLGLRYGCGCAPQLPFFFQTCSKRGRAIVDALVLLPGRRALVVECKAQFSADAWYQLHKFYLPIVSDALRGWTCRGLVVTASFDPWVKVPTEPRLVDSPEAAFDARIGDLCVLISRNGRF
jgi:hypothetical protein